MCCTGKCKFEGYWGNCESPDGPKCELNVEFFKDKIDMCTNRVITGKNDEVYIHAKWVKTRRGYILIAGIKILCHMTYSCLTSKYTVISICGDRTEGVELPLEQAKAYVEMHLTENIKYVTND